MPDLRPVNAFSRRMKKAERDHLRELRGLMRSTRQELSEALLQSGTNGLAAALTPAMDGLKREVSAATRQQARPVEEIATTLAGQQFNLVARVVPQAPPPDFTAAQGATASDRLRILTGFNQSGSTWVDLLALRLSSELIRLRNAEETTEAIAARLLSEGIVDGRASVWRHGSNLAATEAQRNLWSAGTAITSLYYLAGQDQVGQRWRKQAIAAIDERTTDCCLSVHGQIQDLDVPFQLYGTPRFADEIQHPPFHWFCRTGESLYLEAFEAVGTTTREMRDAAIAEARAREETGGRVEIHPASATSRRN